jgi:hypothetical protein
VTLVYASRDASISDVAVVEQKVRRIMLERARSPGSRAR